MLDSSTREDAATRRQSGTEIEVAIRGGHMTGEPTLEIAKGLIDAAHAEARRRHVKVAAAVVDKAGHLIACARMDGASFITMELARRKATTAACFGVALSTFVDMVKTDSFIPTALGSVADLILLPGAVPVGSGALGISGGHYADDQAIADACVGTQ
jgi:uncharacterized protein GlcG (DUF336 family)